MTNKEILQADFLDILFENRNKAYGAYALRRNYNHRLQRSVGISLSVTFLILMSVSTRIRNFDNRIPDKEPDLKLSIIDIPKDKPREPEEIKPKEKPVAETKFTDQIKFVPENIKPDMPDQNEIINSLISDKTVKGVIPDETAITGTKSDKESNKPLNDDEKVTVFSHSDAQFPGGREAFTEFLKKYLVTPGDLEPGEKKGVLVRFMVDVDGTISKTEIVQSGGDKYDKEVIRVLHKMPKWVPAMQNGIRVATYFTQPVTFIGIEE